MTQPPSITPDDRAGKELLDGTGENVGKTTGRPIERVKLSTDRDREARVDETVRHEEISTPGVESDRNPQEMLGRARGTATRPSTPPQDDFA